MKKEESNVKAVNESTKEFNLPQFITDHTKTVNRIRSKRMMYVSHKDIEKMKNTNTEKHIAIEVSRNTEIISQFIGRKVKIHDGKNYITRTVESDMVGHKFGEFAETRKMVKHPVKKGLKDMKKKGGK